MIRSHHPHLNDRRVCRDIHASVLRPIRLASAQITRLRTPKPGIQKHHSIHAASETTAVVVLTPQLLTSAGIFTLCLAAAIFLIAAIPALISMAKVAMRAERVLEVVEKELPESAALMRLSGLEMTECISEISSLGTELSSGIKSTAKLATLTEQGVRDSLDRAGKIFTNLVPLAARTEHTARCEV
jgi:hypothetical protein